MPSMVPQAPAVESPQESDQVVATAEPPSVEVKVCCPPAATVTCLGETTRVFALVIVTVAVADLVVSALAIAVTVTALVGTEEGAV